jgi:hypothetical protein
MAFDAQYVVLAWRAPQVPLFEQFASTLASDRRSASVWRDDAQAIRRM